MFLKKEFSIVAALVLSGVFAFSGSGAEENGKLLRYNLTAGDKFLCVSETSQTVDQTVQEQEMHIETSVNVETFVHVEKVADDGTATLRLSYGNMRQVMNMMGQEIVIDTAKPDVVETGEPLSPQEEQAKLMNDILKAVLEIELVVELKPTGESVVVGGIEQFQQVMSDELAKIDPQMAGAMSQFMDQVMTGMTDSSIEGMFFTYPQKSVKVAGSWTNAASFGDAQFPIDIDLTYTCKSIEADNMKVAVKGKMDMGNTEDGAKVIEMDGMKMNFLMAGLVDGYCNIDLATGLASESFAEHSFDGSIKMEIPVPAQDGGEPQIQTMNIPMDIKGTTMMKITKIAAE